MCTIFAAICSTLMMGYLEQIVYSIIEIRFGLNTKYYFMKNWWKFLDVCKIFLNSRYIDLQKLLEILNPVNSAMQFTMDRVLRTLVFLSFVRLSWEFFFQSEIWETWECHGIFSPRPVNFLSRSCWFLIYLIIVLDKTLKGLSVTNTGYISLVLECP